MAEYYHRDGTPAKDFSDIDWSPEARRVAYDEVTVAGYVMFRVSTVFLGINHRWSEGPPLIFETMIFGPEGWGEEYCERYSTEVQALAGHDQALAYVQGLPMVHEA